MNQLNHPSTFTNRAAPDETLRDWGEALLRGWRCRCPACGTGRIYARYLKVADACPTCGEELHHHRADDAPPYFTILVVGHVVIGGVLLLEQAAAPETWVHLLIWLPATVCLSLILLPRVKGTLIGLQWALRMHGFGSENEEAHALRVHCDQHCSSVPDLRRTAPDCHCPRPRA